MRLLEFVNWSVLYSSFWGGFNCWTCLWWVCMYKWSFQSQSPYPPVHHPLNIPFSRMNWMGFAMEGTYLPAHNARKSTGKPTAINFLYHWPPESAPQWVWSMWEFSIAFALYLVRGGYYSNAVVDVFVLPLPIHTYPYSCRLLNVVNIFLRRRCFMSNLTELISIFWYLQYEER